MRRREKKEITEKLAEMKKRHELIRTNFLQGEAVTAGGLLAQCQEDAIFIGTALEEEGDFHNEAVKRLELYCEAVYEWSAQKEEAQNAVSCVTPEKNHDRMQVRLDREADWVCDYIENRIQGKLEVVFFPYKACMWDSLESVWQAADADEGCDAYVVPIPYFDKNPDGTVTVMHYEGEAFPDYVPIVNWQEYPVAERHPDIIYIHNPYDNANRVTVVHLDYFAKELKKHTDMLVYIPYFVCVGDYVPEHFCVQPATMYADRVIVQSEAVRMEYIRQFHIFEEAYHCRGRFGVAEEKFVALGSPKFDKALQTTRENVEMPKEWLDLILKPDGSRRRVLLYNTSITKLLEGKEQVLKKLKSVLSLMKTKEDVVLLWRPHPLSETTCMAMRPHLLEQYHEIIKEYKKEGFGIYDDTPDVHRAIAVSDAYYGDGSSLVEIYRTTGKPIMIQNIEI